MSVLKPYNAENPEGRETPLALKGFFQQKYKKTSFYLVITINIEEPKRELFCEMNIFLWKSCIMPKKHK